MRIFGLKHGLYFACVKGEPILTTAAFVSWIDDNSDYQVSLETGRWLHELGYSRVTIKRVYTLMAMIRKMSLKKGKYSWKK